METNIKVTDKRNTCKQEIGKFPDVTFLNQSYRSEKNYSKTTNIGTWNCTGQGQKQEIFRLSGATLFWLFLRSQERTLFAG